MVRLVNLPVAAGAHCHRLCSGGGTDILARLMGQWLSERLDKPFIIENRRCWNQHRHRGIVKSAPDGYTLLMVNPPDAINATLYKLNFNFLRDIAPL
jgi:tripartite-type tricarboxylate transporter receptor subunit TctC